MPQWLFLWGLFRCSREILRAVRLSLFKADPFSLFSLWLARGRAQVLVLTLLLFMRPGVRNQCLLLSSKETTSRDNCKNNVKIIPANRKEKYTWSDSTFGMHRRDRKGMAWISEGSSRSLLNTILPINSPWIESDSLDSHLIYRYHVFVFVVFKNFYEN